MATYLANKCMEMCSTSLVVREMQVKTISTHNFTVTIMTVVKKTIAKVEEDVKKLKPLRLAGKNVKWCSRFGEKFGHSSKC